MSQTRRRNKVKFFSSSSDGLSLASGRTISPRLDANLTVFRKLSCEVHILFMTLSASSASIRSTEDLASVYIFLQSDTN